MSRLESTLRRIQAQIDGINWAAKQIADVEGDALELGLGNGRTYDHLRQELPDRRIWVIDRRLDANPLSIPPEENFLMGEGDEMLKELTQRGVRMALVHYEFGIGVDDVDAIEGQKFSPLIAAVMAPGGLVVTSQRMPSMQAIAGPDTISPDRYFFYRA